MSLHLPDTEVGFVKHSAQQKNTWLAERKTQCATDHILEKTGSAKLRAFPRAIFP